MNGLFCPNCGSTKGPFFKSLCKECFLKKKQMLQLLEEIKIEHCKFCGKIRVGGKWVEQTETVLKDFLKKKVKTKDLSDVKLAISLEPMGENTLALVKATGNIDGNRTSVETKTLLVSLETQCDPCMRLRSEYFEATLQLRFFRPKQKQMQELLSEIEAITDSLKKKNSLASVVGVEMTKNGIDVMIGSAKAAQQIVRKLSKKTTVPTIKSFKLSGIDKHGRPNKKFTYSLRF